MEDDPYNDGYRQGKMFAEYHFNKWQDAVGPPFPWPRMVSDVSSFVSMCLLMMRGVYLTQIRQEAIESGIPPEDTPFLPIPRALMSGVEDGYKARLTELVSEFVRRRSVL